MKSYVEILSGIIRVGPESEKYADPFDFAIAFSVVDNKTAVIKALIAPENIKFTYSHARSIIKSLKDVGLNADWERFKEKNFKRKWYEIWK